MKSAPSASESTSFGAMRRKNPRRRWARSRLWGFGAQAILPAFCAVDRAYFRPELTPLRLQRDHTLARGDGCCEWVLGEA